MYQQYQIHTFDIISDLTLSFIKECQTPAVYESTTLADNAPYSFGDTATYECADGYENITPGSTIVCQADGTWNGSAPSCSKKGTISCTIKLPIVKLVLCV